MIEPATRISERVRRVKPSGIRRFFDLMNEMRGSVISLSIGEPDFVTPAAIREAGIRSLQQGLTHYTSNQGLLELREEISRYLERRFGLNYAAKDEIVVTVGGSEAIDAAMRCLLNPGDEVLLPEPTFVAYRACAEFAGATVKSIELKAEDHFRLQADDLEAAISPRTKMLILAYPNNPTGATMPRANLEALLPVLRRHPEICVVSDEIYAELTYDDEPFCSIASFPEMRDRCVVIGGFSKTFAMTGWRLGYAAAPEDIAMAINKVHQLAIMSAPTQAQYAALEAMRHGAAGVERMREAYDGRRRYILKAMRELGIDVFEALGAFYVFPHIAPFGLSSEAFCERLLLDYKVAIVPGDAFGDCGAGYARVCYAVSQESIEEAMRRLGAFLRQLKEEQRGT